MAPCPAPRALPLSLLADWKGLAAGRAGGEDGRLPGTAGLPAASCRGGGRTGRGARSPQAPALARQLAASGRPCPPGPSRRLPARSVDGEGAINQEDHGPPCPSRPVLDLGLALSRHLRRPATPSTASTPPPLPARCLHLGRISSPPDPRVPAWAQRARHPGPVRDLACPKPASVACAKPQASRVLLRPRRSELPLPWADFFLALESYAGVWMPGPAKRCLWQ